MNYINSTNTNNIPAAQGVNIKEYLMPEKNISGAVAQINGRYPKAGFAVNAICKELVYIISGMREIVTKRQTQKFKAGDSIFIDANEAFYWVGNFSMYMTTTPTFDPKQHLIIDN